MKALRVCVFGAGAVGGHLAVKLAHAGHAVCVVARGPVLQAIRERGLTLLSDGPTLHAHVQAEGDAAALGPQDVVFVTLKANAVAAAAPLLAPLLQPATVVVFAQNGIPWWYGHGLPVPPPLQALRDAGQAVAAVVQSSNSVVAPGTVRNSSPARNVLLLAEIDGPDTARVLALRQALAAAGMASPPVPQIRHAVWRKLLLNFAGSPLCVLTQREAAVVAEVPALGAVYERLLHEALAIASSHGLHFSADEVDVAALREASRSPHKPSMLQDFELGRPLETDAILRTPQTFARQAGVPTPVLDTVLALIDGLTARGGGRPAGAG